MREIGAFAAKNKFGQSLDGVEAGDEEILAGRGKVVAPLMPLAGSVDRDAAAQAAERIRARRRGMTLGGLSIEELVAEGRTTRA